MISTTGTRRRVVGAGLVVAAMALPTMGAGTAGASGASTSRAAAPRVAAPTPTAARPGKPTSVAAVGDSITQSTGTGALAQENPKNSWATGWEVNSVAARLGVPTSKRYNYSTNGDTMSDFAPQITNGKSGGSGDVAPLPADAGLVLVEFGGNDLCRDSVDSMTSVATYRAQFKAGLAAVAAKAPNALIQVMSVPDIYNLWYIRGAKQDGQYHPESESDQATGINGARFYWDGLTSLGVKFPCQSLLHNPDSYSAADRQRRADVRARNKAYNKVLLDECSLVLRCRSDNESLFDLTSNRTTPPDGPLLPQAQWRFTDQDISRNTSFGCPIPGLVGGGCGDHFHPSKQGQGKIADVATAAGRTWTDTTFPSAGAALVPSGRPDGLNHGQATVHFSGSDNASLRGQEVRVHKPDGSVTAWKQYIGIAPDLTITDIGTSYVEVRSLDVNGNLSASKILAVDVALALPPVAPPKPTLAASASGFLLSWTDPTDDGGAGISRWDVGGLTGAPAVTLGSTIMIVTGHSTTPQTPPAGAVVRYTVSAVNSRGSSPASAPSTATIAPFGSLAAFVTRQYQDFMGRVPTGTELLTDVDHLDRGTETPAAFMDRLRGSAWFDGAYGPATRLYRAYFLRLPDPSGLDFWARRRREGRTLDKISQQFSVSSEFLRRYGDLTDAAFIDTIYQNVFTRAPDPSGRDFYLRRLAARWTRGQVVLQFSESSEYKRKTAALVASIELHRGMDGTAPDQAAVDSGIALYATGGSKGIFESIVSSTGYRSRIFG